MKKKISQKETFSDKVREVVKNIKKGKILTYKQVATKAGSPNASRAVGNVMKGNFLKEVPCHRVVKSDGSIGDYNRGGSEAKIKILKKEGVKFTKSGKVIL